MSFISEIHVQRIETRTFWQNVVTTAIDDAFRPGADGGHFLLRHESLPQRLMVES